MKTKQLANYREARTLLAGVLETVRKADRLIHSIAPDERSQRQQQACDHAGNATAQVSMALLKIATAIDEHNHLPVS